MKKKPILLATDFSRLSLAAFSHAIDAARRDKAELVILHVMPPPVTGDALQHVPAMMYEEMKAAVRRQAEKKLASLASRAKKKGVRAGWRLVEGFPPESILKTAGSLRARLIVIGTHGRTGWKGLLLGSVAARVIGGSRCPVLAVRAR